jgi:hypothetical protein
MPCTVYHKHWNNENKIEQMAMHAAYTKDTKNVYKNAVCKSDGAVQFWRLILITFKERGSERGNWIRLLLATAQ